MSDKNPCPLCGDDSEYSRFLDLCAERANEIWHETEMKTLTDMYKSIDTVQIDTVQVVRCGYCKHYEPGTKECHKHWINSEYVYDNDFCKWGERKVAGE